MPVRYEIREQILHLTAKGPVSAEEELQCARGWLADPDYRPGMAILLDNRGRETKPSEAHIRKMASRAEASADVLDGTRCAIVVASEVEYGMARMYAFRADGGPVRTRVFRELDLAERWLKSAE